MKKNRTNVTLRRVIRSMAWVLGSIGGTVILAVLVLQLPAVQRAIVRLAVSSITDRTHSRIEVGSVNLAFPRSIVLHDIFVEGLKKDTLLFIRRLAVDLHPLDLWSSHLNVERIRVDSLTAHISRSPPDSAFNFDFILDAVAPQPSPGEASDASSGSGWTIRLGNIELYDTRLTYVDDVTGTDLAYDIGSLQAAIDTFDLETLRFTVRSLILRDHRFRYDVRGTVAGAGVDPDHLRLEGVNLQAEDLRFSEQLTSAHVSHASFRERSGLTLKDLSGAFLLDSVHLEIADLIVATDASRLQQDLTIRFDSLAALIDAPGHAQVTSTTSASRIAIADLLLLSPSLPLKDTLRSSIGISARVSGLVRDLRVESFRLTAGDSTILELTGGIRGLPAAETAVYDVALSQFSTNRVDIRALLPDTLVPDQIALPDHLRMDGRFTGTMQRFSSSAVLTTDLGTIRGEAVVDPGSGPGSAHDPWRLGLIVEDFDLGLLMNDSLQFGRVSLSATAVGSGRSMEDVAAQLDVKVDRADLNGYSYRHILLQGAVTAVSFDGRVEVRDSSLECSFAGIVKLSDVDPVVRCSLTVRGADLQRLNLIGADVQVAGLITADLTGANFNSLNGSIGVRDIVIVKDGGRHLIDSVVVTSVSSGGRSRISVESPILAGHLDGRIVVGELIAALQAHVAHYVALPGGERRPVLEDQQFAFRLSLHDPTLLTDIFLPELHRLDIGTIEGSFDSQERDLQMVADISRMDYDELRIDSLAFRLSSNEDQMQTTLEVRRVADSTFRLTRLRFVGKAEHDSIRVLVQSTRDDGSVNARISGVITSVPQGYAWRFDHDGVVIQNVPWTVSSDNELSFGADGIRAHHVELSGGGQTVALSSPPAAASGQGRSGSGPLRIDLKNWDLVTLSALAGRDTTRVGGILDGFVIVHDQQDLSFTSDLTIQHLRFRQARIGDVTVHVGRQSGDVFEVRLAIAGSGNDVAVRGTYRPDAEGTTLDLSCDLVAVDLASLEPITAGFIDRLSGTMRGKLHVTGEVEKPVVTGALTFSDAAFTPALLNTYLRVPDGRIEFDGTGVAFRSFDLVDTLGNIASIRGRVSADGPRGYRFDVRVHADRFLLLNKPQGRDVLYYGMVLLGCDLTITGDPSRPIIDMQADLVNGTHLTLVLPESELAVEERRGIVRFVDLRAPSSSILSRPGRGRPSDTTESMAAAFDLTAQITVTKESRLRIVIDPVAGDSLVIQGDATLNVAVDPGGRLTVTGQYEIAQGSYVLSFGGILKREFVIERGSRLQWLGSPYDADIDLTAAYTVKAAALDLLQDQLSGLSDAERNMYKQEFPIQVHIIMRGKLLSPEIRFRLDLPADKRGALNGTVYAKLNELNGQESELNKQVFALLILGRFLPQQPLNVVGGSGGLSGYARSSVSQMLSAQLNRLSDRYIAGADLDVGVESFEDYSTGTAEGRTQLQLALTKNLFDERVTVQVGGNVDVEGHRSQQKVLNSFAGDVTVSYKLTEDGRWQLQMFRQNAYEGAIDGDILKTGAGIVFMIEYDTLFGLTLKPVVKPERAP